MAERGDTPNPGLGLGPKDNGPNSPEYGVNQTKETFRAVLKSVVNAGPEQGEQATAELEGFFKESLGGRFRNFQEVVDTATSKEKTSEVMKAKKNKEMFVEVADELIREKRELGEISNDELFLGSSYMEKKFHPLLKGLGREVSKRYVESEEIDGLLNRLEVTRGRSGVDPDNPSFVEVLIQRIDIAIPTIIAVKSSNDEVILEQDSVMMALSNERQRLKEKLPYDPNSRVGSVSVPSGPERPPKRTSGGNGEKTPPRGPTIKQQLEVLINNSIQISQSIENGEGMTSEQAEKFIEGIDKVAQNTGETNGVTPEQINSLVQNVELIAKKIGQGGMTKEQIDGVVRNIGIVAERVSKSDSSTKEQMGTSLEILRQIAAATTKTAEETEKVNEKLSEKMDGIVKITQQQIVSDEVRKFIEDSFKSAGEGMVNTTDVLKKAVDMFKSKLEYSGDAIVLAADVFLETVGKFETSTLDVVKTQERLIEVTKKITEMESRGDLSMEELLRIIQETRGPMTDEEKVREIAKGRLDNNANLSALLFVGKLPASFKELYGKMNPDMKAYWDRQIEKRVANLEAMKGTGANPAKVDELYREMENLMLSKSRGSEGLREGRRDERKEGLRVKTSDVENWIWEIETSQQPSNDISLNSDKLRNLYSVINGHTVVEDLKNDQEKERFVGWIETRLLVHDWFLTASTSHSIEDMFKTTARIHQGDIDNSIDRKLIKFLLDKKEKVPGLEVELPVDEAWDLRQKAYFEYVTETNPPGGKGKETRATRGYLVDTWNKHKVMIISEYKKMNLLKSETEEKKAADAEKLFLTVGGPLMTKNETYGIDKNYYVNLRNEGIVRRGIVEKCMALDLMSKVTGTDEAQKMQRAGRAVELAKRLSVIFYQDSVANIAFADADDYAEIINFKFLRYQDGIEANGKDPKNKPVGYFETIKYIDSLTPSFMHTLMNNKDDRRKRGGSSPFSILRAGDIDFDNMSSKDTMLFHIGSIVFKKVLPVQQLLLKSQSPKDFENFQEVMRRYEQINKTVSEAWNKGFNLLNFKENDFNGSESLEVVQKRFRLWYIASVLGSGIENEGGGWENPLALSLLERTVTEKRFYGKGGPNENSFLSKNLWDYLMKPSFTYKDGNGGKHFSIGFNFKNNLQYYEGLKKRLSSPLFGGGGRK